MMEALTSSSSATVAMPQLASAATSHTSRGGNGLPAFSQVVHEAFNRTADSSAVQRPAGRSSAGTSPNTVMRGKSPRQPRRDEAQGASTSVRTVDTALPASLLSTLQAVDQNQQGQPGASPLENIVGGESGAELGMKSIPLPANSDVPKSAAGSGDQASKENSASPKSSVGVSAEQIQAQLSDASYASLSSPVDTAPTGDAQHVSSTDPTNSQTVSDTPSVPAVDSPAKAPTLHDRELTLATGNPLASLVLPSALLHDDNANRPGVKAPTLHETEPAPMVGGPLPSLPSTGAQSQHANPSVQPSDPPANDVSTQAGSQPPQQGEPQQVSKSTLAPLPVLGTKSPVLTFSTSVAGGVQPAIDDSHATASPQVASTSSSGHGGSQDASTSHKEPTGPQATPAVEASFPASATHDATSGAQSLAAGPPAKPDSAPVPTTAATVIPSPPVATFDRAAGTVATPHQNAPAGAPAPPPLLEGADVPANHFVNNAKLVEVAGHSEMRIAMETDKLGAVELRAHMVGDQVGAAITVEKKDAHAVLAVELPALQQALSDKQLRIEQVTLLHGSLSSTTGDANASAKQDQRSAPHSALRPWAEGAGQISSMFGGGEQSGIFDSQGRLSVHA
jgi:flagellar hook-length control protein FliK